MVVMVIKVVGTSFKLQMVKNMNQIDILIFLQDVTMVID
jgi:hypothetical protein